MTEFLVFGLTAAMAFFLVKSRYQFKKLPALPWTAGSATDLTVVIPARDEAHQIERVVRSFPGTRVLVVDDASSDDTARLAAEAGADVMVAPPLPTGAKGKPNACAAGADEAQTKWVLFVDADTWFEPGFAHSIVAYAEANDLQVVTAFLEQRCETLVEKALLPYAFALYFTGVSAANVNRAESREALANGQCLLFRRDSYQAINGHRSVLDSVIEDVALAQQAKQHGLRLRVIRAERLGHVRMYDGAAAIWRGFEKNSFRFLLINPWSGVQVVAASILLTSWLPVLALAYRDLPDVPNRLGLLFISPAGLLFVAPFLLLAPWYCEGKLSRWWRALLGPAGIYLFQMVALNGMLTTLTGRKTVWKERRV